MFDPFDDVPNHEVESNAKTRKKVRGQLVSYVNTTFSYQHRTSVPMLFVNGEEFRVMRWDRSGVIVTEAINYVKSYSGIRALLETLYAFSKLTPTQRGIDPNTVLLTSGSCGYQRMDMLSDPSPEDLDHTEGIIDPSIPIHPVFIDPSQKLPLCELPARGNRRLHQDAACPCVGLHSHTLPHTVPVFKYIRDMFRKTLVPRYPRYKITISGKDYLVGMHIFLAFGLVGRGTRCFIALEWQTQRLVLLKDAWRPYYTDLEPEGTILSKLNAHNISYIPQLIAYEDVCNEDGSAQETETSNYSPITGDKKVTIFAPFQPDQAYEKAMGLDAKRIAPGAAKPRHVDTPIISPHAATTPHAGLMTADHRQVSDQHPNPKSRMKSMLASNPRAPTTGAIATLPDLPASMQPPSTSQARPKRSYQDFCADDLREQGQGLRHMIHSRMVVRDICLPFTEFTSSRQLVRIVLDCILGESS